MHPWGQTHVFKLCRSPKREVCSAFDRQSPIVGGVIFPMNMVVICGEIHHWHPKSPKGHIKLVHYIPQNHASSIAFMFVASPLISVFFPMGSPLGDGAAILW